MIPELPFPPSRPAARHFDAGSAGAVVATPKVLLLLGDAGRAASLRQEVRRALPAALIQTDLDPLDGLLSAARTHADLVILDAMLAAGGAAALVRHIGRIAPQATVLVFDDFADECAPRCAAHPWGDVAACIERWRDAGPAVSSR